MIRIARGLEQVATNCKLGGLPGLSYLSKEGVHTYVKGGLWAAIYPTEPDIQAQLLTTLRSVGAQGMKARRKQMTDGEPVQCRWTKVSFGLVEALSRLDNPPEEFLKLCG
jgi:hypothetical protein